MSLSEAAAGREGSTLLSPMHFLLSLLSDWVRMRWHLLENYTIASTGLCVQAEDGTTSNTASTGIRVL